MRLVLNGRGEPAEAPPADGSRLPPSGDAYQQRPAAKSILDNVPTLTLPKGGGAIRGIGEKFAVDPATGTASFAIPLPLSPGRGGAVPDLSLTYESGAGAGVFGWGWRLPLPVISRRTDRGLPRYLGDDRPDTFVWSGAEDLAPRFDPDGLPQTIPNPSYIVHRYAPRIEGLFARIERWVDRQTGDCHWRVISPGNVTTIFGPDAATRIADPENSLRIFSWLPAETFDDKGNRTVFQYKPEDRAGITPGLAHEAGRSGWTNPQRHLKRIKYGNVRPRGTPGDDRFLFELVLDYGDHPGDMPGQAETGEWPARLDPISVRRSGFEVRTHRLCERALMFHRFPQGRDEDARLVRALAFDYRRSAAASLITGARVVAYAQRSDGNIASEEMPGLTFDYTLPPEDIPTLALDLDDLGELPAGFAEGAVHWVDLDGDALPGALIGYPERWAFKPNLTPLGNPADGGARKARLGPMRALEAAPAGELTSGSRFADIEGDGLPELVRFTGAAPGYCGREEDGGWIARRPFPSLPNLDWSSPDLRFLDLTGDGLPDIVIAEDDRLLWYPALGRDGYGHPRSSRQADEEETGPRLVFRNTDETIFLADMTGDGLTDLVRIRCDEIVYWPNLGYGHFGPKVAMSEAPRLASSDEFDPGRVRLADTDGSGTVDLVYLGEFGWSVHVNCAGNSFAPPRIWSAAPPLDSLAQVDAFDLLGNGTACLVWSTRRPVDGGRQIRYLPLAGGHKPYLLTGLRNGLGRETRLDYAPSTLFQLCDRMAGKPWATRLPFPVQLVERVETRDRISGHRFTSRYAYHHGYYDGREREFRGFGFVEQWDTETWSDNDPPHGPGVEPGVNEDAASQVPPVRTLRWFHTGMPSADCGMSASYERDFFGGPGGRDAGQAERALFARTRIADAEIVSAQPPGPPVPASLSVADHRDVCRALKGSLLREEIYAEDETPQLRLPYKISVAGYAAELRQSSSGERPAIVFVRPRETLDLQFERDLASPRVQQSFVLKVGQFGDVLERVELAHGAPSGAAAPDVPPRGAAAIAQPRAFVEEMDVTVAVDQPDAWHTPLPAESRRFALVGAGLRVPWPIAPTIIRGLVSAATVMAPTEIPDPQAVPCGKRLIGRSRSLYRRDDLSGPLDFLDLQPKAIPYESYALALTPALVARTFGDRVPAAAPDEAGYVDLEGNGNLWVPGGRAYFQRSGQHPDAGTPAERAASAAVERDEAAAHFFLPRSFRDPYGGHVFADYDEVDLFPVAVEDRVGNVSTATYDLRTLQPRLVIDPNGNCSFAAFDISGQVAATAIAGKEGRAEGDLIPAPDDLFASADIEELLTALGDPARQQPRAALLLGTATTRVVTDVRRFERAAKPIAAVTLSRETHVADLAPGAVSRIAVAVGYADGEGRIVQSKVLTEPAPDPPGGAAPLRWIASGWTLYDNKGNPTRTYEPFHSDSPEYEPNRLAGMSRIIFRDPLSRVIGALNPDGTIEKTRYSAWSQKSWDANDTVMVLDHAADPDIGAHIARLDPADRKPAWHTRRIDGSRGEEARLAAVAAEAHAETPGESFLDALGRAVVAVEDAGPAGRLATTMLLDDDGSGRELIDPGGRVIARYEHDLLGRRTSEASMEAGARRIFYAADGLPLYGWDDRGHITHRRYDADRRPSTLEISDGEGVHLRERIVYGEALGPALNHRGRVHQIFDGAGQATHLAYDFKGAPIAVARRFAREARGRPDWSGDAEALLDTEEFTARTRYDALGRPVQETSPISDRPGAPVSVVQPIYDESGKLDAVDLWLDQAAAPAALLDPATATSRCVRGIDHDAKGQRTAIRYGNGVETKFAFDPETFRTVQIRTSRGAAFPGDAPGDAQNLSYTYDPVGNVVHIADLAQQTIYFAGQVVPPSSRFTYDPLYRLATAEGREHRALAARSWPSWNDEERRIDHPADGTAMRTYSQRYVYDAVGNIQELHHTADAGAWTRLYEYLEPSLLEPDLHSNRLTRTEVGEETEIFAYDPHGNVTRTNRLASLEYDDADRFAGAELGGGGRVDHQYDSTGQRVRKLVERRGAGGVVSGFEERLYFAGFEIFRVKRPDGTVVLERETLHLNDGAKRFLDVESRTRGNPADDPAPARLFRYQFDNHLGSACLELDDGGAIISYEEYHPYGSTSLQTVRSRTETPKRYRYTGKERDEESGLYYHGARYYAPWLGRWMACDPAGMVDGRNLYVYARNKPLRLIDPSGRQSTSSTNVQPKVAPDVMDEIRRLAGEVRDGPVLVIENGEVRTVTYVRNTIITSAEALGREPQPPPPPQTPPPEPDHRFGFYPMKQATEQADRDTSRYWAQRQYGQAAISYGITKFLGVFAGAEQLMPYNLPDHFLSAGQYAKRWIWYDMRGHSGKGLLELGKGHLEAADIVGSADLLAGGVKMIGSSGLTLETTAPGSLASEAPAAAKGFDPSTLNEEAASIQRSIDPHLRGWKGAPVANATTIGVSGGVTASGQEIKVVTASNADAWDLLYFEIVPLPKGMRLGPPPLLTRGKLHWSSHVEVSGSAETLRLGADWVWTGTSRPACWGSCGPLFCRGWSRGLPTST